MTQTKNTGPCFEDKQMLAIFQSHFSGLLNLARIRLLCLLVESLCKVQTVNLARLSAGFGRAAKAPSSHRRIQRFLAGADLPMKAVAGMIMGLLPRGDGLVLVLDRTNWQFGRTDINILMLGVAYRNIAFPLMFKMLGKKGNSCTDERIALVDDFIAWFGRGRIACLLADREFVGARWLGYLGDNNIPYHIRIRENFKVFLPRKQRQVTAWHLFNNLGVGQVRHLPRIVRLHGNYCYLSGTKTVVDGRQCFCIVVSFDRPGEALERYAERWQVETLFRGFKSSGFQLECTHVADPDRLGRLLMAVMIAFAWCYKVGDHLDTHVRPIKVKKHGRRAVSVFKYGLDYISECLLSGFNKLNINLLQFLSCT